MKRVEYLLENFYFLENCNNLASLRNAIDTDVLKTKLTESMHPCLEVLSGIMHRLQLKKQSFKVFKPASDDAIHELWSVLLGIEKSLQMSDTTKKDVEKKTDLLAFMEHCCQTGHYTFQIKKCGKPNCKICK
ncbi:Hypothetical predicted protein [Paramuricea clavata]|uniref:Uncharacterized protein n=1 Tax=Paramuricea clavata TaxID=317549 RepID=A0A7D9HLR7_PARCT|nr:Hypothetical predicted protein [Paramuricea clavata]